jgi:hypothetical protein
MTDEKESWLRIQETRCRIYLENYIETGNVLWAWEALFCWLLPQWAPKPQSFPLPRELALFLLNTCGAMNSLAFGVKPLEYRDDKPVKPSDSREITPSEACDWLPEALELRGHKWNAFADFRRSQTAGKLQIMKMEAREEGLSESEAMERISKEIGLSDPRTVRRKLAGGRGPRQKSPYFPPGWLHESGDEKEKIPAKSDPEKAKKGIKPKTTGAKKP